MLKSDTDDNPNKKNWCSLLKHLLCTLGFYDAWFFQTVGDVKVFLFQVKHRITDQFLQNWTGRLNESSRAMFYRHISTFTFQVYLNIVSVKNIRVSLTKLRVSSHRLCIETGRWNKPVSTPVNERKCLICKELEDEFHFILQCNMYKELRKRYIPEYYYKRPNMLKLSELFKTKNERILRNLGLYVRKAFVIRSEILYNSQ